MDGRSRRARLSRTLRQAWFVVPFGVFLLMGVAGAAFYFYFSLPPTTLRCAGGRRKSPLAALEDRPRPGRERTITIEAKASAG